MVLICNFIYNICIHKKLAQTHKSMRNRKSMFISKKSLVLTTILVILNISVLIVTANSHNYDKMRFDAILTTEDSFPFQIFYGEGTSFTEECSVMKTVNAEDTVVYFEFPREKDINYLRLDLGNGKNTVIIHNMYIIIGAYTYNLEIDKVLDLEIKNDLSLQLESPDTLVICTNGDDPYIGIDITGYDAIERAFDSIKTRNIICAIMYCIIADLFAIMAAICLTNKSQYVTSTRNLFPEQKILVLIVFFICLCGGIMLSTKHCPDEYARFILTDYIFRTGTLPKGNEPEIMIPGWGFSYALRPYLTSLIGAVLMKLASVITDDANVLITMSRIPSITAATITCYFCLKTGNEIFKKRIASFSFAAITCFIPQVLFCGMYLNNDSMSLAAVSMGLFFLVRGHKFHWDKVSCIGLSASFVLCLLSYYTVCLWIAFACGFCVISCMADKTIDYKFSYIIKRSVFIAIITICLSGFFFIRNAILHNGDFLGIESEKISRLEMIEQGQQLIQYLPGNTFFNSIADMLSTHKSGWTILTLRSLIAYFGYLDSPIPLIQYGEYYALFIFTIIIFAIILIQKKLNRLSSMVFINLTLSSSSVIMLSAIQSFYRDYQPQGRYIIIVVLLIGFMFGSVADNTSFAIDDRNDTTSEKKHLSKNILSVTIVILWFLQFIRIWFETMTQMVI